MSSDMSQYDPTINDNHTHVCVQAVLGKVVWAGSVTWERHQLILRYNVRRGQ
uniref:Uncharacterized protein n=1 Tax=Anguilla anguilla TaxID=7936 RepID=A0A0E9WCR1_ANGAN